MAGDQQSTMFKDMVRMQDEQLDDLARGVDRLGNLANTMNDETTLHVNLLNDLDSSVDRAAMGLRMCAHGARPWIAKAMPRLLGCWQMGWWN